MPATIEVADFMQVTPIPAENVMQIAKESCTGWEGVECVRQVAENRKTGVNVQETSTKNREKGPEGKIQIPEFPLSLRMELSILFKEVRSDSELVQNPKK